jgi:hypothetical protein
MTSACFPLFLEREINYINQENEIFMVTISLCLKRNIFSLITINLWALMPLVISEETPLICFARSHVK